MNADVLSSLIQIMVVNIVLSGDNAVVIALAARNLAPGRRQLAILWGCGGAMVLRILMTLLAVQIMKIPLLQLAGASLLVWISIKLLIEKPEEPNQQSTYDNIIGAARTIVIADILMSLDNTLAIAAVANGNQLLVVAGLAISIPLIVFGSTIIMRMMDRFPIIIYIGAGLIAWTAGAMIGNDAVLRPYLPTLFVDSPFVSILITTLVISVGWWHNKVTVLDRSRD
ncbi:TerC family protein [Propionivibrio dicarboxylicus]|uniref:Integral membrane protein, YjbE family n=1 Tax=Propionivibrio dicarboxylicus TaxID=83767 RepID=A0A1G8F0R2_9RHOO|nr:TerC family protein [Propionivibrio dicarboxylicus]SDH75664.1 integral membrane protein, YjbE family [Propionivibrio dicarboxylicus]